MRYDLPKTLKTAYPNIAQACLLIALDNGGINRGRSARKWASDFERFIACRAGPTDDIEAWLSGLSDEDLEIVCCGGEGEPEQVAIMADAPPFTNDLLNEYFEEVC